MDDSLTGRQEPETFLQKWEKKKEDHRKERPLKSFLGDLPLVVKLAFVLLLPIAGIVLMAYPNSNVDFEEACETIARRNGTVNPVHCHAKYTENKNPAPELWASYESIINMPVCNGYQSSAPEQWLDPMTSWILPVLSLLLLVPVAESGIKKQRETRAEGKARRAQKSIIPILGWLIPGGVWEWALNNMTWRSLIPGHVWEFMDHVRGWIKILGDPGSAFCGTFSELAMDVKLIKDLRKLEKAAGNPNLTPEQKLDLNKEGLIIRLCILMGQVEWSDDAALAIEFLKGYSGALPLARDTVRVLVGGRVRLLATVVLPVAFYTGSAVTAYYKASVSQVGDNDTAHMIAYGIWFLFILALAVLANCSLLNADTIQSALQLVLQHCLELSPPGQPDKPHPHPQIRNMQIRACKLLFHGEKNKKLGYWICHTRFQDPKSTEEVAKYTEQEKEDLKERFENTRGDLFQNARFQCRTTKLQSRHIDSLRWMRWIKNAPSNVDKIDWNSRVVGPVSIEYGVTGGEYGKYMGAQILSWIPVAISCGCAAAISFTTPKVALSCRSLNHLFYAFGTFVVILLRPTLFYLKHIRKDRTVSGMRRALLEIVSAFSSFFKHFNIFVITWGTIFQISGLYRNCVCKVGLTDSYRVWRGRPNAGKALTQWNPDTWEHRYWARRVWVPVLIGVWLVFLLICLVSLAVKEYVAGKVKGRDFADDSDQDKNEDDSGSVEEKPHLTVVDVESARATPRTLSYS